MWQIFMIRTVVSAVSHAVKKSLKTVICHMHLKSQKLPLKVLKLPLRGYLRKKL